MRLGLPSCTRCMKRSRFSELGMESHDFLFRRWDRVRSRHRCRLDKAEAAPARSREGKINATSVTGLCGDHLGATRSRMRRFADTDASIPVTSTFARLNARQRPHPLYPTNLPVRDRPWQKLDFPDVPWSTCIVATYLGVRLPLPDSGATGAG